MSLDLLRRYPLFNLLTTVQLQSWLSAAREAMFQTGETIFREGSEGTWAYLVLEGRVRVLKRAASGKDVSVSALQAGELFGDYALLPPGLNTVTCRATAKARLLRLPLAPLAAMLAPIAGLVANLKNWFRLHGVAAYFRDQAFLGFMTAPSALKFLPSLEPVTFRALRTIQADGLSDDRWHFIQNGEVFITSVGEPSRELGPGDSFGEKALLGLKGLPIASSLTETTCLTLPRAIFDPSVASANAAYTINQTALAECGQRTKAYVWIGQREESDCGVAALTMVARFYGLNVALEAVREQVKVGAAGATLKELQRAGARLGLRCQPVYVESDQLSQVSLPAIVHLKSQHYVVVYEMQPDGVTVGDPATGLVRLSCGAFQQTCSKSLLLVRPLA